MTRTRYDTAAMVAGLATALARFVFDPQTIHDVADTARIDLSEVEYDARPGPYWSSVIKAAATQGKLEALLGAIRDLEIAKLQRYLDRFERWRLAHPNEPLDAAGPSFIRIIANGILFAVVIAFPTLFATEYFPWYVAAAASLTTAVTLIWGMVLGFIAQQVSAIVKAVLHHPLATAILAGIIVLEIIAAALMLRFSVRDEIVLRFLPADPALVEKIHTQCHDPRQKTALVVSLGGRPTEVDDVTTQAVHLGRPAARVRWLLKNESTADRNYAFASANNESVEELDQEAVRRWTATPPRIASVSGITPNETIAAAVRVCGSKPQQLIVKPAQVDSEAKLQTITMEVPRS